MAGSILGFSLPTFWVGLMLIMVFAVQLGWLPSTGRGDDGGAVRHAVVVPDAATGCAHLLLPAFNLSLFNISLVLRLTRAGVRETLPMDYVKFARAKGLTPARVIFVHVLKNIMIPVVTVVGLELGSTIAFAVVTESVFAWPGMGKLIIDSINVLDRPVIVAYLMMIVLLFVTINLVVDLLYTVLDPRVRLEAQGHEQPTTARAIALPPQPPPCRPAREETPFRRFVAEFAASRVALVGAGRLRPHRPRRDLRRAHRAAEPLRPRPARHHGRPPAAGFRIGCRLHLHPRHRRPGPRHVLRHPLRPAHLARRRCRLRAHRLRRSAPRSACSPPMSAGAPMPPSCGWSICSCPSPPSSSR